MNSTLERDYDRALGMCLTAMQALRRFDGNEAVVKLQMAIRTIEEAQRRARRDERT